MRFRTLAAAWNEAVFKPQLPTPLALYRIFFGLLVLAKLILLWPDWLNWFGVHGWTTLPTMHRMEPGVRINLFDVLPANDTAILAFFWVALAAAVFLTVGLFTRWSCVAVFLCLVSLDERNLYGTYGADHFLRAAGFFLIFAPAGAALSLDRLRRVWAGKEGPELRPRVVWAQRMIQYQTCLVYFITAWWKATGASWVDGTALYYVHHIEQFRRFPMPAWMDNPVMVKLETWVGLAIEFSLGLLLWIKDLRYWILAAGLMLHLTLEYSMNIPLFQWVLTSTYVLFVDPEDLRRVWHWASGAVNQRWDSRVQVVYAPGQVEAAPAINTLRVLDVFHKVDFREDSETMASFRDFRFLVSTDGGVLTGAAALRELGRVIPALLPFRILPSRKAAGYPEKHVSAGRY